jgi:hypothetical protein
MLSVHFCSCFDTIRTEALTHATEPYHLPSTLCCQGRGPKTRRRVRLAAEIGKSTTRTEGQSSCRSPSQDEKLLGQLSGKVIHEERRHPGQRTRMRERVCVPWNCMGMAVSYVRNVRATKMARFGCFARNLYNKISYSITRYCTHFMFCTTIRY